MNKEIKTKEAYISKISVDSNFTFSGYAWFCSHLKNYCVELTLLDKHYVELLSFHTEMISA